ncbi:interleukin-20 receptor subunit alpha [Nerophis lumbriciformis]|uniref:interleukin-20 receptor subunit alpha n=1 Tax=Nerophis lumbriciformis TaxID=546530 RepID=UPI002AE0A66A|nr:interleukin-20 receptor subunit alpha-like [Nerophis lumbriciformis]
MSAPPLMKIVLFLLGALCSPTGTTQPPSPVNVSFSSVNLRNVLQWLPGNTTPDGTRFIVQYALYGDSKGSRVNWRPVEKCKGKTETHCDLTRETWDEKNNYYGRVRSVVGSKVFSKWAVTQRRFNPKSDTTFGPPLLSVEVEDNKAIIHLKGPIRYQTDDHAPPIYMAILYPRMTYNLSVHNIRHDQVHHFPVISTPYTYRMMDYDTEYCFSAKARSALRFQCQPSERYCLTSSKDPRSNQLQRVVVGIVVLSVCICIPLVVGYFLYHYLTGKEQKTPFILDQPWLSTRPQTLLPDRFYPILIPIVTSDLLSDTSKGVVRSEDVPARHTVSQCYITQECTQTLLEKSVQTQTPSPSPVPDVNIVEEGDFSRSYLTNSPPNVETPSKGQMEQDVETNRRLVEDVRREPFLPCSYCAPSNVSTEDYAILSVMVVDEDEEDASLHINWDPQLRRLLLPGTDNKQEEEEELRLDNVLLRQVSEEEAGPQQAGDPGLCLEDIVSKWNLVISMEE